MIEIPYLLQSFMQVLPTGFKNRCVVQLSFVSLCKEGWVGGNDLGSLYPNSSKKKKLYNLWKSEYFWMNFWISL